MNAVRSALLGLALALTAVAGEPVKHRFICVDNGANRLLCVDQREPGKGWSVSLPAGARDLQQLDAERLLVSHGNGCGIYRLADGSCLWKLDGLSGIQTARLIPDKDQLVLGASGKEAYEFSFLSRSGDWFARESARVVRVPGQAPGLLRLLRLTGEGHLLFTAGGRVVEWDPEAQAEVWSAPIPGKGYLAERLPNGATAVSTGNAVSVVEVDRDGAIVRTWAGEPVRQAWGLDWFSGFQFLPNGRLVVANWLGHGAWGKGPHVIELDRENKLWWSWEDHQAAKQVTNVLVID